MAAVLLACLAAAGFGVLTVVIRISLRRAAEPDLAPIAISLVAAVLVTIVAAAVGAFADSEASDLWPFAAIGAVVPGVSQILFVYAIRDAGPSRATVLIGMAPLISAALAVAFLDEPLRPALVVATVMIVAGGMLLAWEPRRPEGFRTIGIALALGCAVLFAGRDNMVRLATGDLDVRPLAATAVTLAGAATALTLVQLLRGHAASRRRLVGVLAAFAPAGACLAVAYSALVEAFDRGRVTVVSPLNATQTLWVVVLAAVLMRHSDAVSRRIALAAAFVVAGSALIGATR